MSERVLLLSTEFPPGPGGIGTHALHLARQLQLRGWEVTIVSPQDYADEEEVAAYNARSGLNIVRLRHSSPVLREAAHRWCAASRAVKSNQPACLIGSGSRAVWLSALLSRRYRLPWLAVAHGTELVSTGWQGRLTKWAFERASTVVAVSEYTREQMHLAGIRPRRSIVVPNGADDQQFSCVPSDQIRQMRRKLGLEGACCLITVGNVTERKGQDIIIRAMPQILRAMPQAHYLMAGLPTRRAEFEALAARLGVADHVHFLGKVSAEELVRMLNACDLFVMTSRHTADGDFEGFGIAVVEAALCGLPAVVSAPSGLAEAIVDGQTGIAVPREDVPATAAAIVFLLRDSFTRTRMGAAARRRALTEQTWSMRGDSYDVALRSLLSQPTGS